MLCRIDGGGRGAAVAPDGGTSGDNVGGMGGSRGRRGLLFDGRRSLPSTTVAVAVCGDRSDSHRAVRRLALLESDGWATEAEAVMVAKLNRESAQSVIPQAKGILMNVLSVHDCPRGGENQGSCTACCRAPTQRLA